jgi:hypothetical protein
MRPAKWGDNRSVKEAAMKTMALLFLLTVSTPIATAQSRNVDQSTPPVKIYFAGAGAFSTVDRRSGAPPWQDRFNGPDTRIVYGGGNASVSPEDFTSNEAGFLNQMENSNKPLVTREAMFCITLRNTGAKPIRGLTFQLELSDPVARTQYGRCERRIKVKIEPGAVATLLPSLPLRMLPGNPSEARKAGRLKDDARLLRIEYADGSVWNRPD